MAGRLRTWMRRVTSPSTRRLARQVAVRVLDGVATAGGQLSTLAGTLRPALTSAEAPAGAPATPPSPPPRTETEIEIEAASPTAPAPPEPAPVDPRDLGWQLARAIVEGIDTAAAALQRDPGDADAHDPETVRVMRVQSRRLRSLVEVFGPWLGDKRSRRLRTELRKITRALGPVRDLDGFVEAVRNAQAQTDEPLRRAAMEQVVARTRSQQRAVRRRAAKGLRRVDRAALERDLIQARHRLVERVTAAPDIRPAVLALLEPRVAAAFRKAPIPTTLDAMEPVHEVRIQAKRLRYALDWVRPAMTEGPGPRKRLKRVQRAIGTARDLQLLESGVAAQVDELRGVGLATLADALDGWRTELTHRRTRAETRILPLLGGLHPRTVAAQLAAALGREPAALDGTVRGESAGADPETDDDAAGPTTSQPG